MKKLILTMIFCLTAVTAFAGSENCNALIGVCTVSGTAGSVTVKLGAEPQIVEAAIVSMEAEARKVSGIENGEDAVVEVLTLAFDSLAKQGKLPEVEEIEAGAPGSISFVSEEPYLRALPLLDYLQKVVENPAAQAEALELAAAI